MGYNAKVYKVFIASPSDVESEREIVRNVLARWNAINSETQKIVLLPVGWETHSAPESGREAQSYINEEILANCDILIGVFWARIGSPTKNYISGTVEEILRHISEHKLTMLYFSKKPLPNDAILEQVQLVRTFKEKCKGNSLYSEYQNDQDLEKKLFDHIQLKILRGNLRPTRDSDILARILDDDELARQISDYFPSVSKNLLMIIYDEKRSDSVWDEIVKKLTKSPAELMDSLIFLSRKGAFKHGVFTKGYRRLAECSQSHFGLFIQELYSINKFEFNAILEQGLLEDSPFSRNLLRKINQE
jgi:hypothetical protein